MAPRENNPRDKTIARSLGEFFGHLWHGGVKKDVGAHKQTLKRDVQERTQPAPGGKVTVRRTTVEEIEYEPDQPSSSEPRSDS